MSKKKLSREVRKNIHAWRRKDRVSVVGTQRGLKEGVGGGRG